jgi:regulatory protein
MEHTITAIRAQKRNPQRVAIDLDGQFAFGLSRIIAAWLYVGKVLTDADIESLQQSETLELAYNQIGRAHV